MNSQTSAGCRAGPVVTTSQQRREEATMTAETEAAPVTDLAVQAAAKAILRAHDPESWDKGYDPGEHELAEARDAIAAARPYLDAGERAAELPDGQWLEIAFMGHIVYRGAYVREVTRNGQPAYRVELPGHVFGGDPNAVRHHAASSWFGDRPVSGASVRKVWEAQREAEQRRREREAEFARQATERALPAGTEDGGDGCVGGDPF
jgi:hypothetical protein